MIKFKSIEKCSYRQPKTRDLSERRHEGTMEQEDGKMRKREYERTGSE